MNRHNLRLSLILLALLVITLSACSQKSPSVNKQGTDKSFMPVVSGAQSVKKTADPFTYCTGVGTIDAPDARYTGEKVPDSIVQGYLKAAGIQNSTEPSDVFKKATLWRCMKGKVYACNFGANLPCDSKANTDKTPTEGMNEFCKQNANSDFIPMAVTGHDTIYSWHCKKNQAEVLDQVNHVDDAGFITEIWYAIEKQP
jgi:hypothetical protein